MPRLQYVPPDDQDTVDVSAMVSSMLGISKEEYERRVEGGRVLLASRFRKRQRKTRPTLASVAKQASKAEIEVARYEIKPDGCIVIVTTKSEQQQGNEVDQWIAKHADKTQGH